MSAHEAARETQETLQQVIGHCMNVPSFTSQILAFMLLVVVYWVA